MYTHLIPHQVPKLQLQNKQTTTLQTNIQSLKSIAQLISKPNENQQFLAITKSITSQTNPCTKSNSTTHASQSLQIILLSLKQTKARLIRSFSTFIKIHHSKHFARNTRFMLLAIISDGRVISILTEKTLFAQINKD